MSLSRRQLLWLGAGAVGALVVGWGVVPPRSRLTHDLFAKPDSMAVSVNAWVRIGADDAVTLFMPQCEMGQGVHTGLAMLLAEELECRLDQIQIEDAPIHPVYNNIVVGVDGLPFHPDSHGLGKRTIEHLTTKVIREAGVMVTGGSSSVRDLWTVLREAGVMARETLRTGAAALWQLDAKQVVVAEGALQAPDGRSVTFGQLIEQKGGSLRPPRHLPALKASEAWRLIGQQPQRLDSASKIDGSAIFAADVREPGMRHVAIRLLPWLDGELQGVELETAAAMPGVSAVYPLEFAAGTVGGVAVMADNRWQAEQAAAAVRWQATPGVSAAFDDQATRDEWLQRLSDESAASAYFSQGDVNALAEEATAGVAEYSVPYLAHAPMETPSCSIKFSSATDREPARAELWVATQLPGRARSMAAKRLDLEAEQVIVHNIFAGGSFGRRLELDFIDQAAQLARAYPDVMLQCQWTRRDDLQHDFYRPMAVARLQGWLGADGRIAGFRSHSISQSIVAQALPRVFGGALATPTGFDKTQVEGSFDQAYAIPHQRICHTSVELPVPVGFWRAVGHSHQAFFFECFIDELADVARQDPIEFRLAHLAAQPRHQRVLERLRAESSWAEEPGRAADGSAIARGVALNRSFGSIVGQVVEVSLDAANRLRVHRVTVVVDCGQVVHPGTVEQQMQSGVIYGLSAALYGEIRIRQGAVRVENFDGYPLLRLADTPEIRVIVMPSVDAPGGVGEPGLPPAAPALANAVAKLTGNRPRRLPLLDASGIVRGLSAGA